MMKTINKSKKRIFYPLLFILIASLLAYIIIQNSSEDHGVKVEPYKVSDGWGYQIKVNDKVFIDQPFIPVITRNKPFPSRRTASKAGKIVKQKLINRKMPSLTEEDFKMIGIDSLGNVK
jgi:hypothetical protein